MKTLGGHNYYVYILTNKNKTVLYTGMTNDLSVRLHQHKNNLNMKSFSARYKCYHLIYYEHYQYVHHAIAREKEVKGWTRKKKEILICSENPNWEDLNYLFE